ncbi:hypothetical protein F4775DRAFT_48537 [Biscogniauxia sp. FL1348]|nr:hypothetical protein F4775DRAFT_48537 [Biscogniauxia sp. FL1348]
MVRATLPMEVGIEQDEVPPREASLGGSGDAPREGDLNTCVEDSPATPNNNRIAPPNVWPSSLDQDGFPTLGAATSIQSSKPGRQQQRPPIPAEFRLGGSPQEISIPASFSPIGPTVSASKRLWADVVKPVSPDPSTQDSALKTVTTDARNIQPLSPISPATRSGSRLVLKLKPKPKPIIVSGDLDPTTKESPSHTQDTSSSHFQITCPHVYQEQENFDAPTPPLSNSSSSNSAPQQTKWDKQQSHETHSHQRVHSFPSRYPDESSCHTRQYSPTDRSQTTNMTTHSSGVPAMLKGFRKSSSSHSTNRLFSSTSKKSLNVDSPSFTPAQLGVKKSNFSTNAAPFTPRAAAACKSTLETGLFDIYSCFE